MATEFLDLFKSNKNDFYWEATDEPHASRRKQILGTYSKSYNIKIKNNNKNNF